MQPMMRRFPTGATGEIWATGLPRLVTRIGWPVCSTLSSSARQVALNLAALIVSMAL
jgi:hypothetical protein